MTQPLLRVSGVILAGGQSRRMGRDKAFVEIGGVSLIQRVLDSVRQICAETIIVANDPDSYARFDARVVGDVFPGKGSLGGVFSGLQAAREEYVLAVACDMPMLNVGLLRYLISLAAEFDVVIPRASSASGKTPRSARGDAALEGLAPPRRRQLLAKEINLHPMHAVYARRCLPAIEERLRADDLRAIGFHNAVRVRVVEPPEFERFDPNHLSFINVNTPEDLELARRMVG